MAAQSSTRALSEFTDAIREQVAALQMLCRDLLSQEGQSEKVAPREVRIEIRSSLDTPESQTRAVITADSSMECWDHTYVCGKSEAGYVYCSHKVCMIVGPITVES